MNLLDILIFPLRVHQDKFQIFYDSLLPIKVVCECLLLCLAQIEEHNQAVFFQAFLPLQYQRYYNEKLVNFLWYLELICH